MKMDPRIPYIYFTWLKCSWFVFLPMCCGWIYGHKLTFSSIWNPLVMFSLFQSILTLQLIRIHKAPRPEDEDYVFCQTIFASVCFNSPLNIFALFFCSQSSVSLDCIWNCRPSYHSLKRLVCPALCILAVLSNPLVQTPVSLHFPH